MKGLILNAVQEVVERNHGVKTWEAILAEAGVDGVYTSLGSYDDAELMAIVAGAAKLMKLTPEEILAYVGRNAIPSFTSRYGEMFEEYTNTRQLVAALDDVIHVEVAKMYEGSRTPTFEIRDAEAGFDVIYRSHRHLPHLAAGLIEGTALHFDEAYTVTVEGPLDDGTLLSVRPS